MYVSTDAVRGRGVTEGTSAPLSTSAPRRDAQLALVAILYPVVLRHLLDRHVYD